MTKEELLKLVKNMVDEKTDKRIYPNHAILLEITEKASKKFDNYNRFECLEMLRELVKEGKLEAGRTANGHWLTYK